MDEYLFLCGDDEESEMDTAKFTLPTELSAREHEPYSLTDSAGSFSVSCESPSPLVDPDIAFAAEIARRYNTQPALLAACEDLLTLHGPCNDDECADGTTQCIVCEAHEAVRKAKGE